jgi:tetratricopeptide (TPR) repeat protein
MLPRSLPSGWDRAHRVSWPAPTLAEETEMNVPAFRVVLPCLLSAAVLYGIQAQAETDEAVETISYQSFVRVNPYKQSVIAEAGNLALSSLAEARAALAVNQIDRARRDTERAIRALQLVRSTSPSVRLEDGIGALHDQLVRGEGGNPEDLVPIYGDLEEYSSINEAADVREQLDRARGHLGAGKFEEAAAALEEAREDIDYVEIDLPVKETLAKLDRALSEMRGKEWLTAGATLQEASNEVTPFASVASIDVDTELVDVGAGPN